MHLWCFSLQYRCTGLSLFGKTALYIKCTTAFHFATKTVLYVQYIDYLMMSNIRPEGKIRLLELELLIIDCWLNCNFISMCQSKRKIIILFPTISMYLLSFIINICLLSKIPFSVFTLICKWNTCTHFTRSINSYNHAYKYVEVFSNLPLYSFILGRMCSIVLLFVALKGLNNKMSDTSYLKWANYVTH